MNYLKWNIAITNHFFNQENEENEVTLYFSERIILEIGAANFEEPEDGYLDDFFTAGYFGDADPPFGDIDPPQVLSSKNEIV